MTGTPALLEFRLPGRWLQLDPRRKQESLAQIKEFVSRVGTKRDDAAKARAILSENLRSTLDQAESSNFHSIFVCEEITEGVPLPVTITVAEPDVRMSPSIGAAPEAVISTLRKALEELNVEGVDEATEIELEDARVLRIVRRQLTKVPRSLEEPVDVSADTMEQPTLAVDYWYTRPGTKRCVVASFFTPMAEAPHVISDFFDNIVRASRVIVPAEPTEASQSVA